MNKFMAKTHFSFNYAIFPFLAVTLIPFMSNLSDPVKLLGTIVLLSIVLKNFIGQRVYSVFRILLLIAGIRFSFIRPQDVNQLTLMIPIQFLAILLCLKATEMETRRDFSLLFLIGCLFLLFNMLLEESFWYLIFIFVYLNAIFSLGPDKRFQFSPLKFFNRWKQLLKVSILLAPIAFLLFLLFPRIPVPGVVNWGAMNVGRTGLSQGLSPGTIESLMQDERVAFRYEVVQSTEFSPQSQYFYADYLYEAEGLQWQRGTAVAKPEMKLVSSPSLTHFKISLDQMREKRIPVPQGTYEVRSNRYLKIMQTSTGLFEAAYLNSSFYTYEGAKVQEDVVSYRPITERQKQTLVSSKWQPSIQVKELAGKLKDQLSTQSVEEIFDNYFKRSGFTYSLSPGLLRSDDKMTEFLFVSKKGFCEHYAASTGSLLRLMGIPARIALGFLGGDYNPYAKTLSVRYMDAHSWVEYWDFKTNTWKLYDPVAAVAPDRLTLGADKYLLQDGQTGQEFSLRKLRQSFQWLDKGIKLIQTAQLSMGSFMQGFDRDRQREFLRQSLNLSVYKKWMQEFVSNVKRYRTLYWSSLRNHPLGFFITLFGFLGLLLIYQWHNVTIAQLWKQLLHKTHQLLAISPANEQLIPPSRLIDDIARQVPSELAPQWLELGKAYLELAYGNLSQEKQKLGKRKFRQKVKIFLHLLKKSAQS